MLRIDITNNTVAELKKLVSKHTSGTVVVVNGRAYIISYEKDDEKQEITEKEVKKIKEENGMTKVGTGLNRMADELTASLLGR